MITMNNSEQTHKMNNDNKNNNNNKKKKRGNRRCRGINHCSIGTKTKNDQGGGNRGTVVVKFL
jgi:hypothetical protein